MPARVMLAATALILAACTGSSAPPATVALGLDDDPAGWRRVELAAPGAADRGPLLLAARGGEALLVADGFVWRSGDPGSWTRLGSVDDVIGADVGAGAELWTLEVVFDRYTAGGRLAAGEAAVWVSATGDRFRTVALPAEPGLYDGPAWAAVRAVADDGTTAVAVGERLVWPDSSTGGGSSWISADGLAWDTLGPATRGRGGLNHVSSSDGWTIASRHQDFLWRSDDPALVRAVAPLRVEGAVEALAGPWVVLRRPDHSRVALFSEGGALTAAATPVALVVLDLEPDGTAVAVPLGGGTSRRVRVGLDGWAREPMPDLLPNQRIVRLARRGDRLVLAGFEERASGTFPVVWEAVGPEAG